MPTRRILCMDRDDSIRDLVTAMLGFSDLVAVSVSDVDGALRMMKHERFSLYVIDGQMTGVSGLTLCEGIREIDKVTPIVIFSGAAYQSDIDEGMLAGADAYLVKPDTSQLIATIKGLLEGETPIPQPHFSH